MVALLVVHFNKISNFSHGINPEQARFLLEPEPVIEPRIIYFNEPKPELGSIKNVTEPDLNLKSHKKAKNILSLFYKFTEKLIL